MQIRITYQPGLPAPVAAAFIRGNDVRTWLQEIGRWNIPANELECYVLPVSLQSVQASGLLVVFTDPARVSQIELLEPFYCLRGKLYIPLHTQLTPQVSNEELENLLIWEKQVIHPSIGFVGFELKDRLDLASLFVYNTATEADWSYAHTGVPARPLFQQIQLVQPSAEELIESIKKEIGQKALEEIPKKPGDEPSALGKIADAIKFGILSGIYSLAGLLGKIIPEVPANPNVPSQTGLLQQLQEWLERNMEELQKRRNNELNRLLKLFDENDPAALQYAIPLDSPYLDRGKASSRGSLLTRKPADFSLKNLGGAQRVDAWDTGEYYHDLRSKYLAAAEKEIERKDFKKAAYIYAHLLGDYRSAASVLEQGKMYREAAALYKDHLKNQQAAAEILERGGLYNEAIDLYIKLGMDEKTGDLYKVLKQEDNAAFFYEKYVEAKMVRNDYLDAGRVLQHKMNDKERAKEIFLSGWQHTYQSEPCLKEYFDIVLKEDEQHADKKIREVYDKLTPKHKRMPFLDVLDQVGEKNRDPALKDTIQEIAYDIVNKEADDHNFSALHTLRKFVPADKLISSDTSRYVANQRSRHPSQQTTPRAFSLDQQIKWIKAAWHGNQFLVIGLKQGALHMARGNWYANLEYYSWTHAIDPYTRFKFIESPQSNHIILHSSGGEQVTRKNLPKNKYFNQAMVVDCPAWMHEGGAQSTLIDENTLCSLDAGNGNMTLHHYTLDGKLVKSIDCSFAKDEPVTSLVSSNPSLVFRSGYFYSYRDKYIFSISEKGKTKIAALHTSIRFFSTSRNYPTFFIVASTNAGCILFKPENGELVQQQQFFAHDLTPFHITFIENRKFVMAERKKAYVFEILDDGTRIIQFYETKANIVGVLPTSIRAHFAVVEETGKVNILES
jgi:hypothetical protein